MDVSTDCFCTAFVGQRRLASGPLANVALAVRAAAARGDAPVYIFDDATGRSFDVDLRGTDAEVLARLAQPASAPARGRGRPKLGVVAREVTLLPRHWEWLAAQPGGASVALRKLVESARRADPGKDAMRRRHEAAYHFMSAMAGDLPGFEEASRALFADDRARLDDCIRDWPADIRDHLVRLAFAAGPAEPA